MAAKRDVSVITATYNHAASIRDTLDHFRRTRIPKEWSVELIVVNNNSTDDTQAVLDAFEMPGVDIKMLVEKKQGACNARNAGIAASSGRALIFTDEDVHVPENWIEEMAGPILSGEADAVSGGIHLAPHLMRPWMTPIHEEWLASTRRWAPTRREAVGANMALGRQVLEKVPGFSPELGPGTRYWFGEDTLLMELVRHAGFRHVMRLGTSVEHHFDPKRLLRPAFLETAARMGRTEAFFAYHVFHTPVPWHRQAPYVRALKLAWRKTQKGELKGPRSDEEGAPMWEMELIKSANFFNQYRLEKRGPRRYPKLGGTA